MAKVLNPVHGSARGQSAARGVAKQLFEFLVPALSRRKHASQVAVIMSSLALSHLPPNLRITNIRFRHKNLIQF
jgi:hypothetical protein